MRREAPNALRIRNLYKVGEIILVMKISNNTSCPCNSGEKYKKCCMGKLSQGEEQYYALLMFEKKLKDKLMDIVLTEFGKGMLDEYSLKLNGKNFGDEESGFNFLHFFEWFFLEAKHPSGNKILDWISYNYSNRFDDEEISVIKEWNNNTQAGIFEVIEIKDKEWLVHMKDVFNDKEYNIRDRMASMQLIKGDVFYGRVQKIFGDYYLAGVAERYPRLILDQLKDYVNFQYENVHDKTGEDYEEFMNNNGDTILKFEPEKPKFVGSSGDEIKLCEQVYTILDRKHEEIMDWIDKNNDLFIITDVDEKRRKFSASITIKANSKDMKVNNGKGRAMRITSHLVHPETGERILSAGSINIKGDRLKIFCFSEEVLNSIVRKIFNEKIGIGNCIKLIKEDIETPEDILRSKKENKKYKAMENDKKLSSLSRNFLEDYYKKWCDMEIPALENKTPRQAIKTEEGKIKLKELFKDFENIDLHKKREGEYLVDSVKIIRDELEFYE